MQAQIINLSTSNQYYNLNTLSGISTSSAIILRNNTSTTLYIARSSSQPSPTTLLREAVGVGETVAISPIGVTVWVMGGVGPIVVNSSMSGLVTSLAAADLPHDLYTAEKELYRRIKVDPGQTSFHDGREFRTFFEYNIAAGASVFIKANVLVDTILYDLNVTQDSGSLRLTTLVGGTPSGSFSTALPIIAKNTMTLRSTPIYINQNTAFTGGSVAGATAIDIIRVVAANSTAQQSSVGTRAFDQRGIGAGTYYWQLQNIGSGNATGVFSAFWAELLSLGV